MKIFSFLFIILIFITNCQRDKVLKSHGLAYLESRQKLIVVKKSNKNDAIKYLGPPSTKGITDDNLWLYIERTQTKGGLHKIGRNVIKVNNVLVLQFNKYGIVENKEFYNKELMKKIKFETVIIENEIRKESFIYSFLSSLRQKMMKQK